MNDFPVIPGYTIKKKLGYGGMAAVYLALPETLNRLVAIKILNPMVFQNPRLAKRFEKEAHTLSQLTHPNIVTIFEVGEIKDCHFIVMEYFQDSLKERIRKNGGVPPEEALHVVSRIADALFYAHQMKIVHRDVKPDNIMFRQDGTPVILDFGIAKHLDSTTKMTRTGTSVGTPQYMSPEQCNAEKIDGRSDIYSLGIVLFEMLTGKPPYLADTTMGIINQHLQNSIPQLPKRLQDYQPLIDLMMAKDRKKRVQNRETLNNMIKKLLNETGGPISTEPSEPIKPDPKSRKKTVYKSTETITQIKKASESQTSAISVPQIRRVKRTVKGPTPGKKTKTKSNMRIYLWSILIIVLLGTLYGFAPQEMKEWLNQILGNLLDKLKVLFFSSHEVPSK